MRCSKRLWWETQGESSLRRARAITESWEATVRRLADREVRNPGRFTTTTMIAATVPSSRSSLGLHAAGRTFSISTNIRILNVASGPLRYPSSLPTMLLLKASNNGHQRVSRAATRSHGHRGIRCKRHNQGDGQIFSRRPQRLMITTFDTISRIAGRPGEL